MDSAHYDPDADAGISFLRGDETAVKIVVAGPFGVGKTTFIGTLSEIRPLRTEEGVTGVGVSVDDPRGLVDKTSTTVAMDFGRLSLSDALVLYLFGAPGQERFRPMLTDLTRGALGALVLVDTRRLRDSYAVIGLLEELNLPYAVAVNTFPDAPVPDLPQLRAAMDLKERTPLVLCDARDREASKSALIELVEYLLTLDREPV